MENDSMDMSIKGSLINNRLMSENAGWNYSPFQPCHFISNMYLVTVQYVTKYLVHS